MMTGKEVKMMTLDEIMSDAQNDENKAVYDALRRQQEKFRILVETAFEEIESVENVDDNANTNVIIGAQMMADRILSELDSE